MFLFYWVFLFFHSNDHNNFLLSNVDICGNGWRDDSRRGSKAKIFRIHIYIYIVRKEESRGVNRDMENIAIYHTQGLLSSIKDKR